MRSICYGILLWCIALCALASCSDEENVVPSFNVTTNDGEALNHASITFKSEGGSAAINISSNSQWQIECEAEWVDISPREGQGNGSVVITADATTAARSAVAVAYLSDYKQMNQSFNIIQYAPSNADDQPDNGEDNPTDDPNEGGGEGNPTDNPNEVGGEDNPTDNPNDDGNEDKPTDTPNEDGGEDNPTDNPNDDGGEDKPTDNPNDDGNEDKPTDNPNDDGNEDKPTDNPNEDGGENNGDNSPNDNPNDDGNEDNPTDNPNGDGENKDDDGSVDNPENNPDDSNSNTPGNDSDDSSGDDSGDSSGNGSDDGSDDGSGNTPGNTPDGDTPNTDSDNPSDSNQDDDDEQGNEDSVATYTPITTTDALAAGTYYLGGYQGSTLHLASFGEGDRSGHYYTAPYTYDNVSGTLTPQQSAQAIKVTLKAASGSNCYYIHFDGEGYLSATAATAGKLIFTPEPVRAWRFTTGDGGFVVIQDDSLYVKLIISKRAADRLLRSIDGYEEGNPIVLFRQN